MIELGYMAKRIMARPDWLKAPAVVDIYAVSDCMSDDFCDYISSWKHNGFWFFDSPAVLESVAEEKGVDLAGTVLFYYRSHPQQFDAERGVWEDYGPDPDIQTAVTPPTEAELLGYDVVTYHYQRGPECSPLSCNGIASEIPVNQHCLLDSLDDAVERLDSGIFNDAEPGPLRIIAVHKVPWLHSASP